MFSITKKKVAAVALTGAVATTGIAAAAFNWTAAGNGDGSAKAHTQTINITASTPSADPTLYPGNTAGSDVTFKIDNANGYQVTVTSVVANGPISSDAGSACDASNVAFTPSLTGATGTVVAATTTGQLVTLKGNLKMVSGAANACQGALFTIPITVTDTQSGS